MSSATGDARLLEVRGLTVSYGSMRAVDGVDLEVARGEAVGVLGPNGAGKSTLLAALMGCRRITDGSFRVAGVDRTRARPGSIARAGLAVVPEGRRVFPSLSIEDNLALGAWTVRRHRAQVAADLAEVYERFPVLGERQAEPAANLSGGEAQMLSIGMAVMSRPELLLLDEPSFGLAPVVVDAVFGHLERLRDEGMSVLLVEQDTSRVGAFADRVYVLSGGRVVDHGDARLASDASRIADAYLGRSAT